MFFQLLLIPLFLMLVLPVLAFAQATVPAVAVPNILSTIISFLPILLAMAGPYITHILQGYTAKIPAAWQPVLSTVAGIVIAVLGGSATGSTISPDVLGLIGGVTGGISHGLLQSPPIPHPVTASAPSQEAAPAAIIPPVPTA